MIFSAFSLIIFTVALCFIHKTKTRNLVVVLWFLTVCALILNVSPSSFETLILILGVFLPFLAHFLAQGTTKQRSVSLKPSGGSQVISILACTLLASIMILQIYKNRILIDSLWVPGQLKNRTVYQFMTEYYEVGLIISAIVVISTALLSQRIIEGHRT